MIVADLKPLRTGRRQPPARLLLKFQLRGKLDIADSPASVLAANLKGLRRYLPPVLATKLLLITFPKR
jgi:hypothetical protein